MSKDINSYYEAYKQTTDGKGYCMTKHRETSRVRYLKHYLKKYVKPGSTVLDIGCGDMYLSTALPEYNWIGVDIAPDMSNGKAIKQDLMLTPYPVEGKSIDAVVCSEVLEHLWNPEIVHKEVKRVLKPRGVYILSTPNFDHLDNHLGAFNALLYDPEQSHLVEHIRQYNYQTHEKLLLTNGFQPMEHVGADAHYSRMFNEARSELLKFLNNDLGVAADVFTADMVLGRMFPKLSHTIMIVSRHV